MQIYKLNRKAEGYPSGTLVYRLHDVDVNYQGSITCEVVDDSGPKLKMKKVTFARSRLTLLCEHDLNVMKPNELDQLADNLDLVGSAR